MSQTGKPRKPVLLIQHAPHEHPAAVRRALESQGIATRWIHPYRGDAYPNLEELHGLISFGGPMGANDVLEHPWIEDECRLIRNSVLAGVPTVGICLGAQIMARALGARVEKNPVAEVGWFPIDLSAQGLLDPVVGAAGTNPVVYHWHGDTFHLPPQADALASSKFCQRQAFKMGEKVYGFQFHPEADHQLVHEWLAIEGVEHEIELARAQHGPAVQDSETQKNDSEEGEKAGVKMTAAIGQIFKFSSYEPIRAEIHAQIELWASNSSPLQLEFRTPMGKQHLLEGSIQSIFTVSDGKFLIFKEEREGRAENEGEKGVKNSLLWPVRLDFISKLKSGEK